jgi:hypothetical protein
MVEKYAVGISACFQLLAGFFLGLFFEPEEGGIMFL